MLQPLAGKRRVPETKGARAMPLLELTAKACLDQGPQGRLFPSRELLAA